MYALGRYRGGSAINIYLHVWKDSKPKNIQPIKYFLKFLCKNYIHKLIFIHCVLYYILLPTQLFLHMLFLYNILQHFQRRYSHLPIQTSRPHILEIFIRLPHIGTHQTYVLTSTYMITSFLLYF